MTRCMGLIKRKWWILNSYPSPPLSLWLGYDGLSITQCFHLQTWCWVPLLEATSGMLGRGGGDWYLAAGRWPRTNVEAGLGCQGRPGLGSSEQETRGRGGLSLEWRNMRCGWCYMRGSGSTGGWQRLISSDRDLAGHCWQLSALSLVHLASSCHLLRHGHCSIVCITHDHCICIMITGVWCESTVSQVRTVRVSVWNWGVSELMVGNSEYWRYEAPLDTTADPWPVTGAEWSTGHQERLLPHTRDKCKCVKRAFLTLDKPYSVLIYDMILQLK